MNDQDGFVALVSIMIITSLLLVMIISMSTTAFFASASTLEFSDAVIARAKAFNCGEIVLLRLSSNEKFEGSQDLFVQDQNCEVSNIDKSNSAEYSFSCAVLENHALAVVKFIIQPTTFSIVSAYQTSVAD